LGWDGAGAGDDEVDVGDCDRVVRGGGQTVVCSGGDVGVVGIDDDGGGGGCNGGVVAGVAISHLSQLWGSSEGEVVVAVVMIVMV
jgi:hypothetical protein